MEEDQVEMFQLSEVDVLSVGLVQAGAIGEDFFLTKADGGNNMADEVEKEIEVIDTNEEGFWKKIKKFIAEAVASEREESVTVEKEIPVAESVVEPEVELSVEDKGDESMTDEVVKQDVELEAEVKVEVPEEKHTEPNLAAQLADIQKSLETKYEDVIKGLQEKVTSLEQESAGTKKVAEQKEFVQKARDFRALPGKYPEMGEKFYNLSKSSEKEDFDWLMALLKAADEQLFVAGIFNERGTTLTPANIEVEAKVLKQAEDEKIPIDEAMLKLSREDQESMLEVSRQEAK